MTVYLQPTGPTAAKAVLPGDPKRAMELANRVLEAPRMSNLSRGLWGYHGESAAGRELTVQSTGIGGPSTSIVVHELAQLGVREMIRIGTCVALQGGPPLGAVVVAEGALGAAGPVRSSRRLTASLLGSIGSEPAPAAVTVAAIERYYDREPAITRAAWLRQGATVADLGTAALLDGGEELDLEVAAALLVSEDEDGRRLSEAELEERLGELGELGAGTLLAGASQPSSETASRD